VTSQFDVYASFQTKVLAKFIDKIRVFFHTHYPYFMCYCTEYQLSALQARISGENTLSATTEVHNCKNIGLRVKTRKLNTLITTSEHLQLQCLH